MRPNSGHGPTLAVRPGRGPTSAATAQLTKNRQNTTPKSTRSNFNSNEEVLSMWTHRPHLSGMYH